MRSAPCAAPLFGVVANARTAWVAAALHFTVTAELIAVTWLGLGPAEVCLCAALCPPKPTTGRRIPSMCTLPSPERPLPPLPPLRTTSAGIEDILRVFLPHPLVFIDKRSAGDRLAGRPVNLRCAFAPALIVLLTVVGVCMPCGGLRSPEHARWASSRRAPQPLHVRR